MNLKDIEELLSSKYLLIRKGKAWSFLGGSFAFLVVAGIISYQSGMAAIEQSTAKVATEKIIQYKRQSEENVLALQQQLKKAKELISTLRNPEYLVGWTLVYENDSDGSSISGNIESLKTAVRDGADIKISFGNSKVLYVAVCEWAFVNMEGSDEIVSCQNTSHISTLGTSQKQFGSAIGVRLALLHYLTST